MKHVRWILAGVLAGVLMTGAFAAPSESGGSSPPPTESPSPDVWGFGPSTDGSMTLNDGTEVPTKSFDVVLNGATATSVTISLHKKNGKLRTKPKVVFNAPPPAEAAPPPP